MKKETRLPFELEVRMRHYSVPGIGIAVFHQGQMEYREGYGVMEAETEQKVSADSLFHACSISKMITAIGILRLVQEGVLDLDEDVNRYLVSWRIPDNPYTELKKVTLRSLLAHQAGFVDPKGSFDVYQKQDSFPTPKELLSGQTRYISQPIQVTCVPESQFSYSDAGYSVVEQLIEDVTGESFATVMERLVMAPLGLSRTFFWDGSIQYGAGETDFKAREGAVAGHNKLGRIVEGKRAHYPNLSGAGLWSTPTELAILTNEVIKAWNGDTTSILQPDIARMMLTGYGCNKTVGLGVFLPKADDGEPYLVSKGWGVGFQCMLAAYPRLQSGIVVMTNSEPGKPQEEALVGEVIQAYCTQYKWPGFLDNA
ncbi:penicillin-binding protein [Paenibacillus baekrokdamisoli]|uniref:Penicillin-binding protein n=1 Tax=Paenibacillus baekrokdamisoli TaxID=1712516 RepID=A0A3G9IWD1_9BACL|nr:serine hydrolase domain-containing protein [Paenibacillus baekrokdamisoli]MBB3072348.1 CubicO group peptidase (beta-lactamase class C family) [Paenibacillus baekrokdamisoli]BBH23217.1 penicillin-binding protein [Paenibacillus baekrokdamisoli]